MHVSTHTHLNTQSCKLQVGILWIALGLQIRCSAFYKPQAMNNNDCAIQSLTRACKSSVVIIFMFCGLGSRVLLFLQTQRNPHGHMHAFKHTSSYQAATKHTHKCRY